MNKAADRNLISQKLHRADASDLLNSFSQSLSVLSHNCVFCAHNNLKASQSNSHLSLHDAFLIYEISAKIS